MSNCSYFFKRGNLIGYLNSGECMMGKGGPQPAHQVRPGDLQCEAAYVDLEDPEANFFGHTMLPVPQLMSNETFSLEDDNCEEADGDFAEPKDVDSAETINENGRTYDEATKSRVNNSNNNAKKSFMPLQFVHPLSDQRPAACVYQEDILLKEISYFDTGREFVSVDNHTEFMQRFDELTNKTHNNKCLSSIQEEDEGSKEHYHENNDQKERKFGKDESVVRPEERVTGGPSKKRFHRGRIRVLDVLRVKASDTTAGEVIIHQNVNIHPERIPEGIEHRKDMGDVIRGETLDNVELGQVTNVERLEDSVADSDMKSLRECKTSCGASTLDEMEHTTATDFGSLLATGSGWWSAEDGADSPTTLEEEGTLTQVLPLEMIREDDTFPIENEELCSKGKSQEQLGDFNKEKECLGKHIKNEKNVWTLQNHSVECLSEMNSSNDCHIKVKNVASFRSQREPYTSPKLDAAIFSLKEKLIQNDGQIQRCSYDENVTRDIFGHTVNNHQSQQYKLTHTYGSHRDDSPVHTETITHDFKHIHNTFIVNTEKFNCFSLENSNEEAKEFNSRNIPCEINGNIPCQLDRDMSCLDQTLSLPQENNNILPCKDNTSFSQQKECCTFEYHKLTSIEDSKTDDIRKHAKEILPEISAENKAISNRNNYPKEILDKHLKSNEENHLKEIKEDQGDSAEEANLKCHVYPNTVCTKLSANFLSSHEKFESQRYCLVPLNFDECSTSKTGIKFITSTALCAGDVHPDEHQGEGNKQPKEQTCSGHNDKTVHCIPNMDSGFHALKKNKEVLAINNASPIVCYTSNEQQTNRSHSLLNAAMTKELLFAKSSSLDYGNQNILSTNLNDTEIEKFDPTQNLKIAERQFQQRDTLSKLRDSVDATKINSTFSWDTNLYPNLASIVPDSAGSFLKKSLVKHVTFSIFEKQNSEFLTQRRTKSYILNGLPKNYCNQVVNKYQCKECNDIFKERSNQLSNSRDATVAKSLTKIAEQEISLLKMTASKHHTPLLITPSVVAAENRVEGEFSMQPHLHSCKLVSAVNNKPRTLSIKSQTSRTCAKSLSVQCSKKKLNKHVSKLAAKNKTATSSYKIVNKLVAPINSRTPEETLPLTRRKNIAVISKASHISLVTPDVRTKTRVSRHQSSKLSPILPLLCEVNANSKLPQIPARREHGTTKCLQTTIPDKMEMPNREFCNGTTSLKSAIVSKITSSILLHDQTTKLGLKDPTKYNGCVNVKQYADLNSTSNFLTPVEEDSDEKNGNIDLKDNTRLNQRHDMATNSSVSSTRYTITNPAVASDLIVTESSTDTAPSTNPNSSLDATQSVFLNSSLDVTTTNLSEDADFSMIAEPSGDPTLSTDATSDAASMNIVRKRSFLSYLRGRFFEPHLQNRESGVDAEAPIINDVSDPDVYSVYRNVSYDPEDMSSSIDAPDDVKGDAAQVSPVCAIMLTQFSEHSTQTLEHDFLKGEENEISTATEKLSAFTDVNKFDNRKRYDTNVLTKKLRRKKQLKLTARKSSEYAKNQSYFSQETQTSKRPIYICGETVAFGHEKRKLASLPEVNKFKSNRIKSVARTTSTDTEPLPPINRNPVKKSLHKKIPTDPASSKRLFDSLASTLLEEEYQSPRRKDRTILKESHRSSDLGTQFEHFRGGKKSWDNQRSNRAGVSGRAFTGTLQNEPKERGLTLPSIRTYRGTLSCDSPEGPQSVLRTCTTDRLISCGEESKSVKIPPFFGKNMAGRNAVQRQRQVSFGIQPHMGTFDDNTTDLPRCYDATHDRTLECRDRSIRNGIAFREPILRCGRNQEENPQLLPVRLLADSHYDPSNNVINIVVKPIGVRIDKTRLNVMVKIYRTITLPPLYDVNKQEKKTDLKKRQISSRNIIDERAANPPFNTTLTSEADERFRRMFAHWKIL